VLLRALEPIAKMCPQPIDESVRVTHVSRESRRG
jgi:hypothetical protein